MYNHAFESPLPKAAHFIVFSIEPSRVTLCYGLHGLGQDFRMFQLHNYMHVIRHKAITEYFYLKLPLVVSQDFKVFLKVWVIQEYSLLLIASIDNMVIRVV